jgi:hypothetical protein
MIGIAPASAMLVYCSLVQTLRGMFFAVFRRTSRVPVPEPTGVELAPTLALGPPLEADRSIERLTA